MGRTKPQAVRRIGKTRGTMFLGVGRAEPFRRDHARRAGFPQRLAASERKIIRSEQPVVPFILLFLRRMSTAGRKKAPPIGHFGGRRSRRSSRPALPRLRTSWRDPYSKSFRADLPFGLGSAPGPPSPPRFFPGRSRFGGEAFAARPGKVRERGTLAEPATVTGCVRTGSPSPVPRRAFLRRPPSAEGGPAQSVSGAAAQANSGFCTQNLPPLISMVQPVT